MDREAAIWHYCNYQERSHKEVRNKLYEIGCIKSEVEDLIVKLIEADLLNEERYARAIARGKFRMKQWGRNKIIQTLKLQGVSSYCITKALTEIDQVEYANVLKKLGEKKWQELRSERSHLNKKGKFIRYLLQKGYETDLINDFYKEISTSH
ncbi:MAG TPA: regulatory protein RecX [Flavipsychrobacter sp.]|nr:regulatory protein RecX [Flavipsychrobacter sp.]